MTTALSASEQHEEQRDPRAVRRHHPPVEQHADRDEEEPEQDVAERLDVDFHLVAVLGLRDERPGHERPQRERQSGELRDVGEAERDEQHVQHEELRGLLPGNEVEPAAHQPLAEKEQQRQHHCGLDERPGDAGGEVFDARREHREQDEERHHREVLEQQDADDLAPVRRAELVALRENLAEDRGRGHREDAAQREPGAPVEAGRRGGGPHERHGRDDLRSAEPEHEAAHRQELGQAEFQADGEHQEHDADLGEMARLLRVRYPAERVRTDRDADDEIAQHRRQRQRAEQHDDQHRRREQYQHGFESRQHRGSANRSRMA